jgi:thiol-disulfide isomerase/thioredoxin
MHRMLTRRILLFAFGLLLGHGLLAAPVKLDSLKVGDRVYQRVTILGANTTDLYFSHSKGMSNVKLKYLSPELQKQFHYDAATAAAAERAQAEEDARYQHELASQVVADATAPSPAAPALRTSDESLADPVSDKSLLGKPGPKLELEKWLTDKPDLEGKFVLLSFWAPWSVPCRKCIPDLNELQKKFAGKLVVVGLTSESDSESVSAAETKASFALATDTGGKLSQKAGVTSVPCALLLDPAGVVRYLGHPGAITDKKLQMILEKPAE